MSRESSHMSARETDPVPSTGTSKRPQGTGVFQTRKRDQLLATQPGVEGFEAALVP